MQDNCQPVSDSLMVNECIFTRDGLFTRVNGMAYNLRLLKVLPNELSDTFTETNDNNRYCATYPHHYHYLEFVEQQLYRL